MDLFLSTLQQMVFLFALIIIGYAVTKLGAVPKTAAGILSKLENNIFIPALVMGTFIKNFTVSTFQTAWKLLLFSLVIAIIVLPISIFICRRCSKDKYIQNIYTYGLVFANFGFMGNAVVSALFPQYFTEYLIFTLVLWSLIYLWGVPSLLIPNESGEKRTVKQSLKSFVNPMFVAMLIGMVLGIVLSLLDWSLPKPIMDVITVSGDCMSPIAMLITGITIAGIDLGSTLKKGSIYVVTLFRLIIYPLAAIGIFWVLKLLIDIPESYVICAICSLAMPLGLNTIVIPSAYGKDTSTAAGMALVSHLLSVLSIPLIFYIFNSLLI